MRRLSSVFDFAAPVLGGLAAWAHCILGDDRMARWLRTNEEHEPEPIA
jgi:tagatose-1,6-bisphosphate aldolase